MAILAEAQLTAMAPRDGAADCQAQSAVATAIRPPPEPFEHLLLRLRRDAGSLIHQGHTPLAPDRAELHRHDAAHGTVTDGIEQQVGEQAQQLLALSAQRNAVVCRVGTELKGDGAGGGQGRITADQSSGANGPSIPACSWRASRIRSSISSPMPRLRPSSSRQASAGSRRSSWGTAASWVRKAVSG